MSFIPHTAEDIRHMLGTLEIEDISQLFNEIPSSLAQAKIHNVPKAFNECTLSQWMHSLEPDLRKCFVGAGAYEHHIPAAVWELATRGEFYTAYTPYQAEASQGSLQLIYEYQTLMCELMGMDISNASLYDGGTSLSEAALMAVRIRKGTCRNILVPQTVSPFYRSVLSTVLKQQNITVETLPYDINTGVLTDSLLNKIDTSEVAALIIQQPNFLGCIEDADLLAEWAHERGLLVIACVNPLAMSLLKPPGQWGAQGADIVCGEGQPLGIPLASGGPYFGFLCCKEALIRQMPGRIVGKTTDEAGKFGFVLTLQAREQHIRRSKATSNICTNQGLMVVAATLYMSLLGAQGLREVAVDAHLKAHDLFSQLKRIDGLSSVFPTHFFHEFVIRFENDAQSVLKKMSQQGIDAGFNLKPYYPELGDSVLVCVTETKTEHDLKNYESLLKSCLKTQVHIR